MLILRRLSKHGNILPSGLACIARIPDEQLHHIAHSRRHPISTYGRSLGNICSAWHSVLDLIEKFEFQFLWKSDEELLPQILDAYKKLLFVLYEHLDATYSCIRAVFPPQSATDPLLDAKFLDRLNPVGWKEFKSKVKPYLHDRLGATVNSIKHNQAELSWIYLNHTSDIRAGYYVRDVQPNGSLGPALRVHSDGNSAFSYSRDMLLHIWNLYYVSDEFSKLVEKSVPAVDFSSANRLESAALNAGYQNILERLSKISFAFFPDEVHLPFPQIRWNPISAECTMTFPSAARPIKTPKQWKIKSSMLVDAAHPNNKMPYFGANAASQETPRR